MAPKPPSVLHILSAQEHDALACGSAGVEAGSPVQGLVQPGGKGVEARLRRCHAGVGQRKHGRKVVAARHSAQREVLAGLPAGMSAMQAARNEASSAVKGSPAACAA